MPAMLPAPPAPAASLAGVLTGALAAVAPTGHPALAGMTVPDDPPGRQRRAIVVLVDGLGSAALAARAGHARALVSAGGTSIPTVFPSTTAAALASLCTGRPPGEHGLIGYTALDAANDRVLKLLSGWDAASAPRAWQRLPTVFERARDVGVAAIAIGPARYERTGFSAATLAGAQYRAARSIGDRGDAALTASREPGPGIVYVYVPELDMAAHRHGWRSPEFTAALEEVDGAVARLASLVGDDVGVTVTADHGMLDLAPEDTVRFGAGATASLVAGVRHVAGDARCLQLHLAARRPAEAERLADAWRCVEGERVVVATREESIAAGWWGPLVADHVAPVIGDVVVVAAERVAYVDGRRPPGKHPMVGQHGGADPDEVRVPLIRFGAATT